MLIKLRPNLDLQMASYMSLKPFTIFFFIFITITTFFLSSHCDDAENFTKCSMPYYCGDIKNVTFPFWGDSRPKFCGLQGFDLACKENQSFIRINQLEFRILKLNQSKDENKMTIAMANSCSPPESPRTTLDFHLFKSDPKVFTNLTLIYDCSEQLMTPLNSLPCDYQTVYYADDNQMEELGPNLNQTCRTVKIPVSRATVGKIMSGKIFEVEEALREGFEVEYHAPAMEHCRACLGSGGCCGSNTQNNSFVCYCRDHLGDQYTCNSPYIPPQSSPQTHHNTNWRSNVTGTCRSVQVPAFKSAVDEINFAGEEDKEQVLEALKQGFDLNYVDFKLCNLCRESGGECGSNISSQFLCICREGIRDSFCHVPEKRDWGLKAGIGVGAACFAIVIMCIGFFFYQRNYKKRNPHSTSFSTSFFRNISSDLSSVKDVEKGGSTYLGVHVFTYEELVEATNNFDPSKELGDGGFGTVYYGKLQDGRGVAVKRLYESNYRRVEQFMNEVEILAHVRHPNLVQLYGCTSRHSRELLLVYEYISNGTVADHLHGEKENVGALPWPIRLNIAVESALALTYLHATDIIHRDVKTNNILLDNNFSVKVADFGLSRLFPTHVTHISTAPQGTPGYVDPEYHHCYQLTSKSDVFSFGVVLVELISSMPAVDITRHRHDINLSTMAINRIQNHALHEIVDPSLGFDSDSTVRKMITAVAELAFQCLQNEKDMRPSMIDVLEELKAIQSRDYSPEKAEKKDVVTDEAVLLKNGPLTLSPDSVTANWVSRNTTPNASG